MAVRDGEVKGHVSKLRELTNRDSVVSFAAYL